jgi:hypothetical protein
MDDKLLASNIVHGSHTNAVHTGTDDDDESTCYTYKRFDENEVTMLYDIYKIAWKQMRNMVEVHKRDCPDGRVLAWVVKPSVDAGENATTLKVSMVLTLCQPPTISKTKQAVVETTAIKPNEVAFGKDSPLFTEVSCSSASNYDRKLEKTDDFVSYEYDDSAESISDDDNDDAGIEFKSTAEIVEQLYSTHTERISDSTSDKSNNKDNTLSNPLHVVCSFNKDASIVINNACLPTIDNVRWRIINPSTQNTITKTNNKIESDEEESPYIKRHDCQQNLFPSNIIYLRKTSNPTTAEETAQCFYSKVEVKNFLQDNYGKVKKHLPSAKSINKHVSKNTSEKRPPNQVQVVMSSKKLVGAHRANMPRVLPLATSSSVINLNDYSNTNQKCLISTTHHVQRKKGDKVNKSNNNNNNNNIDHPRRKRSRTATTNSNKTIGYVPLRRWCQSRCCHQTCWTAIWQHLQSLGWIEQVSHENSEEIITDAIQDLPSSVTYYLPPNGKIAGGRKGTHFFVDSADVMEYCKKKY